MSSSNYPLATATWDDAEYQAIQKVIASGMFTMGAHVQEFEKQFAAYTGSSYCVMVNSGSSANLLMIAALRFRKESPLLAGEEIIVPAVSWSTTYHPLQQYGLKLKFVDIDRDTLNYDIKALAEAVTDKTRAIMIVNLLGNPNDFDAIERIIAGRNIVVVEDNCESLGAQLNGRQAGTFGVMGTYSAFFSHHISTMEGGMVVTDDEELYHIMLSVRAHGWTRNLPKHNKLTGTKSDDAFVESFKFVLPGYNLRPLEMSGAIGIEQVRKLPGLVSERRRNAVKFQALMADYPQLRIQKEIGESSWFGFSMIVEPDAGFTREDVVRVFNDYRIDVRPIVAGNFAKNEVLRWFDYEIHGSLKNADELDSNGLFIGNHHYELDEQFELLRSALDTLIKAKQ
ncbi:pyridoxamine 5-phosphate oxidase [Herbaspirillum rubrisubalbicans]|uniref:Pyridoxamine 5-phosphate oxidase n=1 Tax=Herbaspirillum rubrisubalbicans TaxID=80842 RepID=A0ABX9BV67_9BURK|nr:DegT/DnrJ/EryC1/StrS family aminotransferase [Herbaspirillum rubrisubalbicans]RAM61659.1 pyridoxamine 5-phosphate oxidase [Herbaspirillum rubrisubalbicans]RAN44043.1 pyridoxamine 5-phosphate oxidase [Herbaspirillum rubrisubalbicans]